ncbi:hypothetical protein ABW09_04120 [Pluralibacter gergoviae]|nr:hypothetical protein ABW09_04120 [Pluralibacter gergoviae]
MPNGFWHLADVVQTSAGNQLSAAMIGGAVHTDDFPRIAEGVIKVIEQFFKAFEGAYFSEF